MRKYMFFIVWAMMMTFISSTAYALNKPMAVEIPTVSIEEPSGQTSTLALYLVLFRNNETTKNEIALGCWEKNKENPWGVWKLFDDGKKLKTVLMSASSHWRTFFPKYYEYTFSDKSKEENNAFYFSKCVIVRNFNDKEEVVRLSFVLDYPTKNETRAVVCTCNVKQIKILIKNLDNFVGFII